MADEPALPVAAGRDKDERRHLMGRCALAVVGIMSTLLVYGVLQEKLMRVPYGAEKEFFKYSLFLVFCNGITTSMVSALVLLVDVCCLDGTFARAVVPSDASTGLYEALELRDDIWI